MILNYLFHSDRHTCDVPIIVGKYHDVKYDTKLPCKCLINCFSELNEIKSTVKSFKLVLIQ